MTEDDRFEFKLPDVEFDDDLKVCPKCFGAGVVVELEDGVPRARLCECQRDRRAVRFRALKVPSRYRHCTLDNFATDEESTDPSIVKAFRIARRFVDNYPAVEAGLLFMGPPGIGKTHLAFAIMQELALTKGAYCRWCDFSELLSEVKKRYSVGGFAEYQVLEPLTRVEILLIDDLGSMKIRDWTLDLLSYVINQRYINKRIIIATTNFLDKTSEAADVLAEFSRREETLEEQIGPRLRSRLFEMCMTINMKGPDSRAARIQNNLLRNI
jgi:DNA replication protein DnaC